MTNTLVTNVGKLNDAALANMAGGLSGWEIGAIVGAGVAVAAVATRAAIVVGGAAAATFGAGDILATTLSTGLAGGTSGAVDGGIVGWAASNAESAWDDVKSWF